jgi:hypothetical protein
MLGLRGGCGRTFPNLPGDERERGQTDTYALDVSSCNLSRLVVRPTDLFMRTLGRDAWLPLTIKIIANLNIGGPDVLVNRSWPSANWFSTDPNDWPPPRVVKAEWALAP